MARLTVTLSDRGPGKPLAVAPGRNITVMIEQDEAISSDLLVGAQLCARALVDDPREPIDAGVVEDDVGMMGRKWATVAPVDDETELTDQERYAPPVAAIVTAGVVDGLQRRVTAVHETLSRIQREELRDLDRRVDVASRRLDAIGAPAGQWLAHVERQTPSTQSQRARQVEDLGGLSCAAPWGRMGTAVTGTVIDGVPGAAPCDDAVLAAVTDDQELRRWFTPAEWQVVSSLDGIPF